MKSVTQKKYSPPKQNTSKHIPSQFCYQKQIQRPFGQNENRRFSQFPASQILSNARKQSGQSRITYNKSQYPMNRKRSVTPVSRVTSSYGVEYQLHYKQLEQVLKKQNENFYHQNQYLKQEIAKLYERQAKYKHVIKRYKQQLRVMQLQNQVYQQRYHEIKSYINNVIQKITQITISNDFIEDKDMLRNSSLQLVNKLREDLNNYQLLKDQKQANQLLNNSQQSIKNHQGFSQTQNQNNLTNHNIILFSQQKTPDPQDLQQTRYIKQPKYQPKTDNKHLKRPPKPTPTFKNQVANMSVNTQLFFSPISNQQSSPSFPNSQQKNLQFYIKTDNFLQDTSESNHANFVNQQIEELTDQSEALMYELKKKGNQDQQIKKKIIRISQKIRQLKMQTQNDNFQRFTSLQQINPKY